MLKSIAKFLPLEVDHNIKEIYISLSLRSLAISLILIYTPIYLYLNFNKNIGNVFLFYGFLHLIYGLIAPLGGKINSKIGLKKSIILSYPFLVLYYIFLRQMEKNFIMVYPALFSGIIYLFLFYPAFHTEFVKFSKTKERSKEISFLNVLISISQALGPVLGGLILFYFNFSFLFLIVIFLIIISIIPLLFAKETKSRYHDTFHNAYIRAFLKMRTRERIQYSFKGAEQWIQGIVWPIFLYLIAFNFAKLGGIITGAKIISLVVMLGIGRLLDLEREFKNLFFKIMSLILGFVHILKSFVSNLVQAFFIDSLQKIIGLGWVNINYYSLVYDRAKQKKSYEDEYIISHEIILNFVGGFLLILISFLANISYFKIQYFFIIAGIFAFIVSFSTLSEKKINKIFIFRLFYKFYNKILQKKKS